MTRELSVQRPSEVGSQDRQWGLSVIKSAYVEMYPDCQLHFISEIANKIEQSVFTKTNSSQHYQETLRNTANSILALAKKTARNVTQRGFSEATAETTAEATVGGTLGLPRSVPNETSVDRKQIRQGMTSGPYSVPDASDVVKLVPFILEAGVQVLGKIGTAQQVRALGDAKKSTIGFLAYERLSKSTVRGGRGLGASSGTVHESSGKSSTPLGCSTNDGIIISRLDKPKKTRTAQLKSEPCLAECPPHADNKGKFRRFNGSRNWVVNDLQHRNKNRQETRSKPPMAFGKLKAKYREKIEMLHPLVETQSKQSKDSQDEINKTLELRDSIAFVRAGLMQDNVTNPDTLRSLENLTVRILHHFGYLLRDNAVRNSIRAEDHSDKDGFSTQDSEYHPQETDDSEELGETDSETEDDDDEGNNSDKQEEEYDRVADALDKIFERQGYGISEDELWNKNEESKYIFEEGELPEDDLKEHDFMDTFLAEIFEQEQHIGGALQTNAQSPNEAPKDLEKITIQESTVNRQLELLLETINEQQAESPNSFGLEPIPFAGNGDNAKDESGLQNKVQAPKIDERKIEEAQASASLEDSSVPVFTPRRSNRIRSQASIPSTQPNLNRRNISSSAKTPLSAKETSAKTPRTRKTPRSTPRKTPRK